MKQPIKNNLKNSVIKKYVFIISLLMMNLLFNSNELFSQCQPYIKIDGNNILANQTVPAGLALPYWLTENQTLAIGQMVNSISVIEFSVVNNNSLEFSKVLSVSTTSPQTVPSGKVWKIESISKQATLSEANGASYSSVGTYTFVVPPCANYICIEVWGGGGGGGGGHNSSGMGGGGGGGGGYGQGCFSVTPGASYTVIVGDAGQGGGSLTAGAAGGTSSVGSLISATGGSGGGAGGSSSGGTGGAGGSSTATVFISGGVGGTGIMYIGGDGGSAGGGPGLVGGDGGTSGSSIAGTPGSKPGGGGGAGGYNKTGAKGAPGKVIITW